MEYYRVNNDVNGNPRYVFHFLNFLNEQESFNSGLSIRFKYELALDKARKIGGKKYRGKDFGYGIVFQSYNIDQTIQDIEQIK